MNLSICTADIGLADTFFTLADGWSFGLHGHSFGHVLSTRNSNYKVVNKTGKECIIARPNRSCSRSCCN